MESAIYSANSDREIGQLAELAGRTFFLFLKFSLANNNPKYILLYLVEEA